MTTDASSDMARLLEEPTLFLDDRQRAWSARPGAVGRWGQRVLYAVNRFLMRWLFRLRVEGLERLPERGPFILAPNHSSSLDPMAIGAALPLDVVQQSRWAGLSRAVLRTPVHRLINRLAGVIPIDRDRTALAVGVYVLRDGRNLVWFPEGKRSPTGELQPFKPGVGILMLTERVPVVPIYVDGAHEALPTGSPFPRFFRRITVWIGEPLRVEGERDGVESIEAEATTLADTLRERLLQMQADRRGDGE